MKYHKLNGLTSRDLFSLVLKARSLRSRCLRAVLPPEAPGKRPSSLCQLLRSLAALSSPWLVDASLGSLPWLSSVCVFVCLSSFYNDTGHWTLGSP